MTRWAPRLEDGYVQLLNRAVERWLEHAGVAGAVAARHVAEHFFYHPHIQSTWRNDIAPSFLKARYTRTEALFKT